ncbi:katanin p80 WD40 repeat-containing subunit B1-like isoform X1 [Anneissia japonica]|uniref:katanin p80 WD40 repeat-containing subunit B1-like isoform X1 n=1 Tax=Anneissia japonica TaxID=1529436 RepID=UPI0014259CAA|nr:katanin p80 WD40 repeat-containing subunit B1-like isoform X1 [Anneissia japonica]XP_033113144.1 katanin p80 WD40 repeat-containing subunit B1-like isoform X2 [Anneissia japonica]XP_033113145.1 katanin p80 WD40 repeat-containing subunit B1-like isoform X1 [Anneissia japonica]XP_033113146.1 katanin p80 WD40 repeat-containing subunit B1-like isoform X1 [Anneissia japonica]
MTTKKAWKLQEFVAHGANVNCLALGPKSGRVMVTGGEDKKVNMWAVGKPNCIMGLSGHTTPVECVRFSSSEELVVAGSQSGGLKIWDLEAAKIVRTLTGHKCNIKSLDFHPYGDFVASGSMDTNLKLWDVRRKGCIFTYKGHTGCVNSIRFSPDGRWIASASDDGLAKLWDLTAGKLLHDFQGHTAAVNCVEFHPNEFLFSTASNDRTVKFWDLETFELVSSSSGESSGIRSICFHPEGNHIFTGSQDMLRVYSWEPVQCFDSVYMGWGKVADMAVSSQQIIGASFNQTNVAVYVADLSKINTTTGVIQDGGVPVPEPQPNPCSPPLSSSGRKNFNTGRPHTSSTKPRQQPEMKRSEEESSPSPEDQKEDETSSTADIQDQDNYEKIFKPNSTLSRSPTRKAEPFPAPLDEPSKPQSSQPPFTRRVPDATPISTKPSVVKETPTAKVAPTQPQPRYIEKPVMSEKKMKDTIIPANREKPIGLDVNEFLPAKLQKDSKITSPVEAKSESEVIESLNKGHDSMCAVMSSRSKNLQVIKAIWTTGDTKTAVESAINMRDQALLVDILNVLCLKKSLWTLDLCVLLLPKIKEIFNSKYENYVLTSCTATKLILKSFSALIKTNINLPPQGIDIMREERYNKCNQCYGYLITLRQQVEAKQLTSGKLGSTFRELKLLFTQLD